MAKNITSINDKKIKDYQLKIKAKTKELGDQPRPSYVTNQLLPLGTNKTNLSIVNTVEQCVGITSNLMIQAIANQKANEILGTSLGIQLGGYSIDEWISDIKTRLSLIRWKEEKTKLDQMNANLAELLSQDAKTTDAIQSIVDNLDL